MRLSLQEVVVVNVNNVSKGDPNLVFLIRYGYKSVLRMVHVTCGGDTRSYTRRVWRRGIDKVAVEARWRGFTILFTGR